MPSVTVTLTSLRPPAPSITDPLLTTNEACTARGRHVLYSALPYIERTVEAIMAPAVEDGHIARVLDPTIGDVRGQVTGVRHRHQAGGIPYTSVTIRTPR